MKVLMSLGIVITLSLVGGSVEAKAAGCEAIGNVRFICDQLGPEDLAAVPGSDWVLSSGMAANRGIRLINLRDKSTTVLFPGAASRERPNKKTYESCPGPIGSEGDKFRAHGLYLRPGQNAVRLLEDDVAIDATVGFPRQSKSCCVIASIVRCFRVDHMQDARRFLIRLSEAVS